jgi:RNA polymerase sigma factor (sigma-70 family)
MTKQDLEELFICLTAREEAVVLWYWYEGYTFTQIGKMLGVKPMLVKQINAEALRKMAAYAKEVINERNTIKNL